MRIVLVFLCCSLAGCAIGPKKEYEWVGPSGTVAPLEKLATVKQECNYDNKIEQGKRKIGTAVYVRRYEKNYNTYEYDTLIKEADTIISEAKSFMREKGYVSREKKS